MGLTDWLLGNRTVIWSRDARLMAFRIEVARGDGTVVEKMITEDALAASRLGAIELVQALFDHPLDRIAVGLVARREWFTHRAIVAAVELDLLRVGRTAPRRADPAPEDAAYRENSEKSKRSPRKKRPALAPRNPRLPLYDPR